LVEKFHPTDCIKIGFFAAGELFLKNNFSSEEIQLKFKKISDEMLKEINGDIE
jgi:hypothetical protein